MIPITEINPQNYLTAYEDWLADREDDGTFKRNTVRAKEYAVEEFVDYYTENDAVIDLEDFYGSVDTIKQFFKQTAVTKNKVAGVRCFLGYIARQLETEQEERLDDIRDRVKRSKLEGANNSHGTARAKEIEDKILSEEELDAVLAVAQPFEELLIRCMLDTGCRPGELAALAPQDFSFDVDRESVGATVKIEKTYNSELGAVQDSPKSEESYRTVNLRPETAEMLQDWIAENDVAPDELIFESYRTVYDAFKDVFSFVHIRIGDNGITNLGPHALRHNTCTRLRQNDVPKEKVQQYMGHSSVMITEIYEHFNEDEVLAVHG